MGYANCPSGKTTIEHCYTNDLDSIDRIHWGGFFDGLVVAIMMQLLLSEIGASLGFTTIANSDSLHPDVSKVGTVLVIRPIISLFISLFVGSWVTSRSYLPINQSTSNLNRAIFSRRLRWRSGHSC